VSEEQEVEQRQRARPADWPSEINVHLWIVRDEGHFEALCQEFTVVGRGSSPEAANAEMFEMLDDYLRCCAQEARPWGQVLRPAPLSLRARLHLGRVLGTLGERLRNVRRRSEHGRLDDQGLHLAGL
jgi:hypothetical protein